MYHRHIPMISHMDNVRRDGGGDAAWPALLRESTGADGQRVSAGQAPVWRPNAAGREDGATARRYQNVTLLPVMTYLGAFLLSAPEGTSLTCLATARPVDVAPKALFVDCPTGPPERVQSGRRRASPLRVSWRARPLSPWRRATPALRCLRRLPPWSVHATTQAALHVRELAWPSAPRQ